MATAEMVELSLELVTATQDALLLSEGEGMNQGWLAKSLIENLEDLEDEIAKLEPLACIEVIIPEWVAKNNGWI
jgi:hypothetical protein